MTFSKYSIEVVIRILLIVGSIFLFFLFINQSDRILTVSALIFLTILQTGLLIRFTSKHLKYISDFLDIMDSSGNSSIFHNDHHNKELKSLQNSFNRIGKIIQKARIEKESSDLFLRYTIDKISIGILAFDEENRIEVLNDAARKELKIEHISHINEMEDSYPEFPRWLRLKAPQTHTIYNLEVGSRTETFLFTFSEIIVLQRVIKIVSFQNIGHEMGKSELDSYKKLTRILTHEIMNTVTPITSLSVANRHLLSGKGGNQPRDLSDISQEDLNDLYINTTTLEERSRGLMDFVERFRKIGLLPLPVKVTLTVRDLFQDLFHLYKSKLTEEEIEFSFTCKPEELSLQADKNMITQVLINLVKNSMQALEGRGAKQISLNAFKESGVLIIQASDNGQGIHRATLNDVFIPFFSTRKEGSGIGLTYSREVMLLHGGSIQVSSVPERRTTFELVFRD
jgi:two-component system nitrogen regulation sensor histidine kinase NtrY